MKRRSLFLVLVALGILFFGISCATQSAGRGIGVTESYDKRTGVHVLLENDYTFSLAPYRPFVFSYTYNDDSSKTPEKPIHVVFEDKFNVADWLFGIVYVRNDTGEEYALTEMSRRYDESKKCNIYEGDFYIEEIWDFAKVFANARSKVTLYYPGGPNHYDCVASQRDSIVNFILEVVKRATAK